MLDSPIVLVTLCYYGLSKNELPLFIKAAKSFMLKILISLLVEMTRVELATSCLQSTRSPS